MRIIARGPLKAFADKHPDAEPQLEAWYAETKRAKWATPTEVKAQYRNASILRGSRVVFNICGNKYRLVTKINYETGIVFIRFLGTHKEYDQIDAETV